MRMNIFISSAERDVFCVCWHCDGARMWIARWIWIIRWKFTMNFHFPCQLGNVDWCHVEDFLGVAMADVWIISNCCFFIFMKGLNSSVSFIWIFTTETPSDGIKSVTRPTFSYGWRFFSRLPRRRKKVRNFLDRNRKEKQTHNMLEKGWKLKSWTATEKMVKTQRFPYKKKWSCWKVTSFPSSLFSALWAVLKTCEVFHSLKSFHFDSLRKLCSALSQNFPSFSNQIG